MTQRTATAETLVGVLKASAPGDEVLFSGDLSVKTLVATFADPGVTVRAAAGATISGWPNDVMGSGLRFAGFKLRGESLGLWAAKGGWLAIEDSVFEGGGLVQMGCVQTRRCTFRNMPGGGVSIQGGRGHVVEDCTFDGLAQDGINIKADGAVTVRRNRFTRFRGDAAHRDCIQVLAGDTHGETILIEGNVYERGEDATPAQGVFTDAAPGPIVVRRNAFYGGPWQTIALYGATAGTIVEDNFLQGVGDAFTPQIRIEGSTAHVEVRNNVTVGGVLTPSTTDVVTSGNTKIANAREGDRGALEAWLAGQALPSAPAPAPAPGPAPAPQPGPASPVPPTPAPPASPAPDARDAVISELRGVIATMTQAEGMAAALTDIAALAAAGKKATSAAKAAVFFDRILARGAPA